MHVVRRRRPLVVLAALLLLPAACATDQAVVAPQFHELEDVACDDPGVDCVSELLVPATYQKSKNMHLLGFSGRVVPLGTPTIRNSDLAFWGRTAYQGTYEGFRIIDIADPENPTEVLNYTGCVGGTTTGAQGDLVIWKNLLVRSWDAPRSASVSATCGGQSVTNGWEGVHVFDISNPASPQLLAAVETVCGSHTAMGVPDLANDRLLIYSASSSSFASCAGLDIIEVPLSDPASASLLRFEPVGGTDGIYCHDGSVILGTVNLLACAGGTGAAVWSLSADDGATLEDPVLLYTQVLTGVTIGHSTAFTWDGAVLVFGHEPGGGGAAFCRASDTLTRTIFFLNARTGASLGSFLLPRPQGANENCTWHNFNVVPMDNRYILVAGNYQAGISVVDFTNPAAATEIAFADPAPVINPADPTAIVASGDWSTYWYNGLIYESDQRRGLLVWNLSDPSVAGARKLDHLNPQTQETSTPLRRR